MCGINGFNFSNSQMVSKMNETIIHRGPDAQGVFTDDKVSLGHVRLSILDLSDLGKQPMEYSHNGRTLQMVFNGEVYNFEELRVKLETKGYSFKSTTDTEVMMAAYLEYGEKCVEHFNGMWALCIYDVDKQTLFCSRDRLGQKPFYYYHKNGQFIFSSEIKSIVAHADLNINKQNNISKEGTDFYFSLGYIPAPYTIYSNVNKLPASHNITYNLSSNNLKVWRYYELPNYAPIHKSKEEFIEEGRAIFKDAVKYRMRSDVEVGSFLSGGIDSTSVVGMMKSFTEMDKLHTFSIGFKEGNDETEFINIAKDYMGTKHHHYYYEEADFRSQFDLYTKAYDEPFSDYSGYSTLKVSELAKENVTVSLSGDGGDEVFGGYPIHSVGKKIDKIKKVPAFIRWVSLVPLSILAPFNTKFANIADALKVSLGKPEDFHVITFAKRRYKPEVYKKWTREKLQDCLSKGGNSLGEALRIFDLLYASLPDCYLVKVDRASMQYALEVRSPFLDYRFAEFAQTIPSDWKQDENNTKILLKGMARSYIPDDCIDRPKHGFTPPIKGWVQDDKFAKTFEKGFELIKNHDPELYKFYKEKIMPVPLHKTDYMTDMYRFRLVMYVQWYEAWIEKTHG